MTKSEEGLLRPMTAEDLGMVLSWRNHPEIRRYMYAQHEISMEEHSRWFEKASRDVSKDLLIFEIFDNPAGSIKFDRLRNGRVADWGFYLAPNVPSGTGRKLGEAALEYAFVELDLHKVCGQVLAFNEPSSRFHEKLGFSREGNLRQQFYDGAAYHDVILFGLLAAEWKSNHDSQGAG